MPANAPSRHTIDSTLKSLAIDYTKISVNGGNLYSLISPLTQPYMSNSITGVAIVSSNILFTGAGTTTITIAAPAGQPNLAAQVQAVVTPAYGIGSVTPVGGTSYTTGDLVTIAGGAIGYVTASGGVPSSITFTQSGTKVGTGYTTWATGLTTSGGTGSGLTVNITGLCLSAQLNGLGVLAMSNQGSGYSNLVAPSTSNQQIQIGDSNGGFATLVAVLGNTDNALNYLAADYAGIQAAVSDVNALSQVIQGNGIVQFGGSKSVTGATNAANMVLSLNNVLALGINQEVVLSGFTPTNFNGITGMITAITLGSSPAGTVTLNNVTVPGAAYVSGGFMSIAANAPIMNTTGYPFLNNLYEESGLVTV